jgi:hypothetical protein
VAATVEQFYRPERVTRELEVGESWGRLLGSSTTTPALWSQPAASPLSEFFVLYIDP